MKVLVFMFAHDDDDEATTDRWERKREGERERRQNENMNWKETWWWRWSGKKKENETEETYRNSLPPSKERDAFEERREGNFVCLVPFICLSVVCTDAIRFLIFLFLLPLKSSIPSKKA